MKKSELRALIKEAIKEQFDPMNLVGSGGTAGTDYLDQLGGATPDSFDAMGWALNFGLMVLNFPPPQSPCSFLGKRLGLFQKKFERSLIAFNDPALQGGAYGNEFQMMYQNQLAFKLVFVHMLYTFPAPNGFGCTAGMQEQTSIIRTAERFLTPKQRSLIQSGTRDIVKKYNELRPAKPIKPIKPIEPMRPIDVPSDGPVDTTRPVATGGRPIRGRSTDIRENSENIAEAILNESGYVCQNPGSNACNWITGMAKFMWTFSMTNKVNNQVANPCNFIPKQLARMVAYRDSQVPVKGPDWKAVLDYKIGVMQALGENPDFGCEMGVTPEPGIMDI